LLTSPNKNHDFNKGQKMITVYSILFSVVVLLGGQVAAFSAQHCNMSSWNKRLEEEREAAAMARIIKAYLVVLVV
jgi:hypothetical protein